MGIDARIFVTYKGDATAADLKRWSWEIGAAFGADYFWRSKHQDYAHHNISRATEISQDHRDASKDVKPVQGESLLEVHVGTRYYGEGYERGNLPFILSVLEWLEAKFPGGTVYYGGDSSGVLIEPFPKAARDALFKHFAGEHGADYRKGWGALAASGTLSRHCDLCDHGMGQFGYGAGFAVFRCLGCGKQEETRDGGKTWAEPKKDR